MVSNRPILVIIFPHIPNIRSRKMQQLAELPPSQLVIWTFSRELKNTSTGRSCRRAYGWRPWYSYAVPTASAHPSPLTQFLASEWQQHSDRELHRLDAHWPQWGLEAWPWLHGICCPCAHSRRPADQRRLHHHDASADRAVDRST